MIDILGSLLITISIFFKIKKLRNILNRGEDDWIYVYNIKVNVYK